MSAQKEDKMLDKINKVLNKLVGASSRAYYNTAIIVAAGAGTRMGDGIEGTKQMFSLCGMPVVARTIAAFEACDDIDEIIIGVRQDEMPAYQNFIREYDFKKITHITEGGETRQDTVMACLEKVSEKTDYITIHDGVRCLVTPEMIREVATAAYRYGAATAAHRAKDTVKLSDKNGFIEKTTDRDQVYLAGTPQIFKADIYRAAAYSAKEDGFSGTDDNMLAERWNFKIRLCDVGYENIKITTQEDLFVAEAILKARAEREEKTAK